MIKRIRAQAEEHLDRLVDLSEPERDRALEKLRNDGTDAEVVDYLRACLDDGFLSGQAGDVAPGLLAEVADGTAWQRWIGRRLGAWEITGHLGSGGMGHVFQVERADGQYQLTAALKLLTSPGGEELLQRFQQERQILARLDHPRIARLLDGGTTDDDLPFLVMEFVDGEPIDAHCERLDLDLERRLELFLSVCDAVQYAHQNLVIHRDLKPANILVDTAGRVKLLDFGVAKLLSAEGSVGPEVTRSRVHPLTPEYAAPEQLRNQPITTATDVYALGVLLYRLLAGHTPFDLREASLSRMVEVISGVDPSPPSRDASPAFRRKVTGDLDAIALKALAKDPDDRYGSAERLADEIRAYLSGAPVSAGSPSAWQRARKFARRHRVGVTAGAAVVLALTVGLGAALWQAEERSQAAARAQAEAERAAAVRDFLVSLFEAASPAEAQGRELTARQVFDQGTLRMVDELEGSPELKSELLLTLASIAHQLGDQERGMELVDQSLDIRRRSDGPESAQVADALRLRGSIQEQAGTYDASRLDLELALEIHRRSAGSQSDEVAADLVQIASLDLNAEAPDSAADRLERALQIVANSGSATNDPAVDPAVIEGQLAMARRQQGRLDEARRLYERSLDSLSTRFGEHHPETVRVRNSLAALVLHQGDYAAAQGHFQQLAADNQRVYGEDHPLTITALNNLAVSLSKNGHSGEAAVLFRSVLEHWQEAGGPSHPRAVITQINLATALSEEGDFVEAEHLYRDALPRFAELFGAESPQAAVTLLRLADVRRQRGDLHQARDYAAQALSIHRQVLPAEHPTLAANLHLMGQIDLAAGDRQAAAETLQTAFRMRSAVLGEEHPDTIASRDALTGMGVIPEPASPHLGASTASEVGG